MESKEIIKELRKSHGYTVEQVATGADIPKSVYPKYESGILNAGVPVLIKLADFYGVSVDYLLGREKDPEPMEQLANQMSMQEMEADIFERWLKLSPKEREIILNVLRDIVHKDDVRKNPALSRIYLGNNNYTSNTAGENSNQEEQQEAKPAITKIENQQMAVARTSDPERLYRPLPTEEQMASFIPVTPDMLGE